MRLHTTRSASPAIAVAALAGFAPLAYAADALEATAPGGAPRAGFAVVELFTSEGCSSCPAADRLLGDIHRVATERDLPVYVLSMHVPYWDNLGWTDPYGSATHTQRQRDYAAALGERSVYTPQMVVNGVEGFVGSNGPVASRAVSSAVATPAEAGLTIRLLPDDANRLRVVYSATGAGEGTVLNLAVVQERGAQQVERGENQGRRLEHTNIVRGFQSVAVEAANDAEAIVPLPEGLAYPARIVAYLQDPVTKRVLAAAAASIAEATGG